MDTKSLTHHGPLQMRTTGVAAAEACGQPHCIVMADARGQLAAEIMMIGAPSANVPEAARPSIEAATGGAVTGLLGGLPIIVGGAWLGGICVGPGAGEQDSEVAQSALAAIGADT